MKNIPEGTNFISYVIDDETAPCGAGLDACVHAGFFNLSKSKSVFAENDPHQDQDQASFRVGGVEDGFAYIGPFPPPVALGGTEHTYKLTVYAHKTLWAYGLSELDGSGDGTPVTRAQIQSEKAGDIVGSTTLTFKFTNNQEPL